jgi:hypothetical protein
MRRKLVAAVAATVAICAFPLAVASAEHRDRDANTIRITKLVPVGSDSRPLSDR